MTVTNTQKTILQALAADTKQRLMLNVWNRKAYLTVPTLSPVNFQAAERLSQTNLVLLEDTNHPRYYYALSENGKDTL